MNTSKLFVVFLLLFPVISFSQERELKLYYWNKSTNDFDLIKFSEPNRIPSDFSVAEKTVVIIHGFSDNPHTDNYRTFAKRIKKVEPKTNVLVLDWLVKQDSWVPGKDPVTASRGISEVAQWTYQKLFDSKDGLGISTQNLHIIGFSHGSHVAALIGKRADGNIAHLTLLDPSPEETHLCSWENFWGKGWSADKSGKFVDVYRTSKWASTGSCRGHFSFFVLKKGEPFKEDSIEDLCKNHNYAFFWYVSTIGKQYTDFGYSIAIPDTLPVRIDQRTGTIFSSLPKPPSLQDYDTATDYCEKNVLPSTVKGLFSSWFPIRSSFVH